MFADEEREVQTEQDMEELRRLRDLELQVIPPHEPPLITKLVGDAILRQQWVSQKEAIRTILHSQSAFTTPIDALRKIAEIVGTEVK